MCKRIIGCGNQKERVPTSVSRPAKCFSLFGYEAYMYLDRIPNPFAEEIFKEKNIKVKILYRIKFRHSPSFAIVYCKVKKKYRAEFFFAMVELMNKINMIRPDAISLFCHFNEEARKLIGG